MQLGKRAGQDPAIGRMPDGSEGDGGWVSLKSISRVWAGRHGHTADAITAAKCKRRQRSRFLTVRDPDGRLIMPIRCWAASGQRGVFEGGADALVRR